MDLTVSWAQLNLSSAARAVRDLNARHDQGRFADKYTAKAVPPHGSVKKGKKSGEEKNNIN